MKKIGLIIALFLSFFLSSNYAEAQKIELLDYVLYPCEESHYIASGYYQERIIEDSLISDTLTLLIATTMNCGSGDVAYIRVSEDSIHLYSDFLDSIPNTDNKGDTISWREAESYDCTCCFTLEYIIKGISHNHYVVTINDKVIEQLPNKYIFPLINDFGDTTVFIDQEGYFHRRNYNSLGELYSERKENSEYSNNKLYYKNGQLWIEEEYDKINGVGKTWEYSKSGELIK
jgi:hypothetical protein